MFLSLRFFRFHTEREEVLDYDILPPLDDDVQLSVEEYRRKLYQVDKYNSEKIILKFD